MAQGCAPPQILRPPVELENTGIVDTKIVVCWRVLGLYDGLTAPERTPC